MCAGGRAVATTPRTQQPTIVHQTATSDVPAWDLDKMRLVHSTHSLHNCRATQPIPCQPMLAVFKAFTYKTGCTKHTRLAPLLSHCKPTNHESTHASSMLHTHCLQLPVTLSGTNQLQAGNHSITATVPGTRPHRKLHHQQHVSALAQMLLRRCAHCLAGHGSLLRLRTLPSWPCLHCVHCLAGHGAVSPQPPLSPSSCRVHQTGRSDPLRAPPLYHPRGCCFYRCCWCYCCCAVHQASHLQQLQQQHQLLQQMHVGQGLSCSEAPTHLSNPCCCCCCRCSLPQGS
jgi:hypothetical protein